MWKNMSQIDHSGYIWKRFGMSGMVGAKGLLGFCVIVIFFRMTLDLCFVGLKFFFKLKKNPIMWIPLGEESKTLMSH